MPEFNLDQFTVTQRRIVQLLMDGRSKPRSQVLECLDDPMADYRTLRVHLTKIREVLRPLGLDVVCLDGGFRRTARYRLVRQFMVG